MQGELPKEAWVEAQMQSAREQARKCAKALEWLRGNLGAEHALTKAAAAESEQARAAAATAQPPPSHTAAEAVAEANRAAR